MGCVVVWHHRDWDEPAYQLYSGLLFGLPLAVTSFNRLCRLLESLYSRLGGVLISFYFDDATITDPQSARGSGQWAANEICHLVGSPFAAEKQQTMQSEGTFLGLTHDFSVCRAPTASIFGFASDSTTRSRTSSTPPATLSACPKALPQKFME